VIYQQRNELLEATEVSELIGNLRNGVFTDLLHEHIPPESIEEQWDVKGLQATLTNEWQLDINLRALLDAAPNMGDEGLLEKVLEVANAAYQAKVAMVGKEAFGGFERSVMLQSVDSHWREHLAALDHLRQGIHLRGYAQKNPKQEYKREAFQLFGQMLDMIKNDVVKVIMLVRIQSQEQIAAAEEQMAQAHVGNLHYRHADFDPNAAPEDLLNPGEEGAEAGQQPQVNMGLKVGRNDPCPCGSGKKYKACHGKLA
jgi:preprotein translocase subunit SecA